MPLPTSPPWDYPRACGAYIDSNKDATDEQIETANRIEKELSKTSDGEALLNAYLDIDVKKFDESWAEDDVKHAENSMPSPHNDNPIILFGGKEFASSMVDRSVARNKLKSDIAAWEMFIDNLPRRRWRPKTQNYNRLIRVMDTPLALTMAGVDSLPMFVRQGKVNEIRIKDHPAMTDKVLKQLPGALTDPLAIIHSSTRGEDSVVVILSLNDENKVNVVVPVALNKKEAGIELNLVSSAYGKQQGKQKGVLQQQWFEDAFSDVNRVYYLNRKKAQALTALRVQFPGRDANGLDLFHTPSILHEEDLVKARMQNPTLYQQMQGATSLNLNGQYLISLFSAADESTMMHEMAHVWLLQLEQIAAIAPADSRAAKDYNTIMEWAAWRPGQVNEFTDTATAPEFVKLDQKIRAAVKSGKLTEAESLKKRWAQERFARGFEDYLRTGEAPSVGLRKIFRQFKKWLTNLYRGYTSVGAPVSDDVKAIMDRMLATEEEIEMAAAEQSAVANVNGFPFTITGSTARIVCTTPC